MISQELLKTEVKLLLSARKSYMKRQSAEQRVNLSDLKRPFHESRAVSAVAELLVYILALPQHKVICCGVTSVETQCTLNSMLLDTDKNSERK